MGDPARPMAGRLSEQDPSFAGFETPHRQRGWLAHPARQLDLGLPSTGTLDVPSDAEGDSKSEPISTHGRRPGYRLKPPQSYSGERPRPVVAAGTVPEVRAQGLAHETCGVAEAQLQAVAAAVGLPPGGTPFPEVIRRVQDLAIRARESDAEAWGVPQHQQRSLPLPNRGRIRPGAEVPSAVGSDASGGGLPPRRSAGYGPLPARSGTHPVSLHGLEQSLLGSRALGSTERRPQFAEGRLRPCTTPKDLPTFTPGGEQSALDFLRTLRSFAERRGYSEACYMHTIVPETLKGDAEVWWNFGNGYQNWDAFQTAFQNAFLPKDHCLRMAEELLTRSQGEAEPFLKFVMMIQECYERVAPFTHVATPLLLNYLHIVFLVILAHRQH